MLRTHHLLALGALLALACSPTPDDEADAAPPLDASSPDTGADASSTTPDASEPVDASDTQDVAELDAGDASEPELDAGGVQLGDPAPPGPPPELDPEHPLRDVGAFERVLPGELVASVDNIQWLHETAQLQFALGKGGRGSVPKEDDQSLQLHPFSMWTLQAFTDGERAWESMRLPTKGRDETHWCALARSTGRTWCNHNMTKAQERFIRITSGDGLSQPLVYESVDLPGQHVNLYSLAEASDGALYVVVKKGIGLGKSYVMKLQPSDVTFPSGAEAFERMTDPCVTGDDGVKTCVPTEDVYGVALSPDDQTLYFTTGGFQTEGGVGALWSAPRMQGGSLGTPSLLVGSVPKARGVTVDEQGNLYVASGLDVRVYNPAGQELGVLDVVVDPAHVDALENDRHGKRFTALSVAFGGPYFNVLHVGIGYDRKGAEIVEQPTLHTHGGLFRVELKARGAWAARHGIAPPE